MKKTSASMKADYQKYLQSSHWQKRRKCAIEDTGHMCEKCDMPRWLAQIAYQQDLNVHHLNYANLGHEEDCDLEVLCRRCHDIETFGRSDFRAPKQAECTLCGNKHWNIYGNYGEVCLSLMSITEPLSLRFEYTNRNEGNCALWKYVVRELVWYFNNGNASLSDLFLEISTTLKRANKPRNFMESTIDESDVPF